MDIIFWALLLLAPVAALAFISKTIQIRGRSNRKLPPGPKPWPVIGNLNLVSSIPHQSFHSLSQKYGDLMLLNLGKFPVVVASSPDMAKQFLRVHDTAFASRPALTASYYLSFNYSDLSWAPYGPYWRQARHIFLTEVFAAKKLEFSEQIRVEEMRNFLSRLRGMSGKPVVLRDHLSRHALLTMSRMLSRKLYFTTPEEQRSTATIDEFQGMVDEWIMLTGAFNVGDWIPWLGFLDLHGYVKRYKALRKKIERFYDHVIDDHLSSSAQDRDVMDALLLKAEDSSLQVKLTRDCVKALFQNLLLGGIAPFAITVEWAICEILKQPRIMAKAKEELDTVIGRSRWLEEKDLPQLPYMNSIIKETFRLHPPCAINPHYAIEDSKVAGYDIKKGTTVLINAWSIGRDPNSWDAPLEFLPERFMVKEIDMTGSNFALLPFGSGRRVCPGYCLALKMVGAALANLLHGFDLKLGKRMRAEDICMEEEFRLIPRPKRPLSIIIDPTLPAHLY